MNPEQNNNNGTISLSEVLGTVPATKTKPTPVVPKAKELPLAKQEPINNFDKQVDHFCKKAPELFEKIISFVDINKDGQLTKSELAREIASFPNKAIPVGEEKNYAVALSHIYREIVELEGNFVEVDDIRAFATSIEPTSVNYEFIEGDTYKSFKNAFISLSRVTGELFSSKGDIVQAKAVQQELVGNCTFQATMAALAEQRPEEIEAMVKEVAGNSKTTTYEVNFPGHDKPIQVAGPNMCEVLLYRGASELGNWPLVLEKAYGEIKREEVGGSTDVPLPEFTHNEDINEGIDDPSKLKERENFVEPMSLLTGSKITENVIMLEGQTDAVVEMKLSEGKLVTFATAMKGIFNIQELGNNTRAIVTYPLSRFGMLPTHAYAAIDIYEDDFGGKHLVLFEPTQKREPLPEFAEDVKRENGEYLRDNNMKLADGFFSIPLEYTHRYFAIIAVEE